MFEFDRIKVIITFIMVFLNPENFNQKKVFSNLETLSNGKKVTLFKNKLNFWVFYAYRSTEMLV